MSKREITEKELERISRVVLISGVLSHRESYIFSQIFKKPKKLINFLETKKYD